jgi:alginate O-acetyltransferase complex protein AlgI
MTFNTLTYLFFFISVMLGAWLLPGRRAQQFFLTVASLYFYGAWNHWLVLLIVASAVVDFLIALRMSDASTPTRRRIWLIVSLTSNLGMLSFFKYSNFLLDSVFSLQKWAGLGWMQAAPHWNIILPIGISFYTFQTLSYTVDIYRRKLEPVREFPRFLLFISFFPQLVAGPIVRATDFLPQLEKRAILHARNLQFGFTLFLVGLVKKVVFADGLGSYVENIYGQPELYTSVPVILATVAYAVQIYCDFSGYTDMAIGSAAALGFWLPKNFRHPYFSGSVTEFWGRWHISLSTWLRDYLYIPLGGNREGAARTNINLLLVMLLGGLWHGAKWTFVLWGFYQGLMLVAHRFYSRAVEASPRLAWYQRLRGTSVFRVLSVAVTLYLVLVGWIFFRAENFADLQLLLHKFVVFDGFHQVYGVALREAVFVILLISVFFVVHFASYRMGGLADRMTRRGNVAWCALVVTGLFLVVTLTPAKSPEFIYFQF